MAEPVFNWRPTVERRVLVAASVMGVWTLGIVARLVFLQVYSYDELTQRAERQYMRTVDAPAKRGEIFDRRGHLLAYSVDADTIYAVPHEVEQPTRTAAALCAALDDCSSKDRAGARRTAVERSRLHLRQAARHAGRGAQGRRAQARRHRLHEGEPALLSRTRSWGRTRSATSVSTTSVSKGSKRPTTRSCAATRAS